MITRTHTHTQTHAHTHIHTNKYSLHLLNSLSTLSPRNAHPSIPTTKPPLFRVYTHTYAIRSCTSAHTYMHACTGAQTHTLKHIHIQTQTQIVNTHLLLNRRFGRVLFIFQFSASRHEAVHVHFHMPRAIHPRLQHLPRQKERTANHQV